MTNPITLIGLVASVLQLVAASTVYNYVNDVKNAPEEQRELSREYASLEPLLEELKKRVLLVDQNNPDDPRVTSMRELGNSLADCEKKIKKLATKLQRFQEIHISFDANSQTGKPNGQAHLRQFCLPYGLRHSIQSF